MSGHIPFDQVNAVAMSRFPDLVREWFPNGKRRGKEWIVGNLRGDPGESFKINVETGRWGDFNGLGETGRDPIDLYAALHTNGDRVSAARELGRQLGVNSDSIDLAPLPRPAKKPDWQPCWPPDDAPPPPIKGWDHAYAYCDERGQPFRYVLRKDATETERKKIVPLTYGTLDGREGWHQKHAATPRSLYGLDRLMVRSTVFICEGEKAADAAQGMLPKAACITWTAGTSSLAQTDWSPLEDRHVIIWPDNDEPGHKAAAELVQILAGIASTVRLLTVDDLPDKADAADLTLDDPTGWVKSRIGPVIAGIKKRGNERAAPPPSGGRRAANLEPIRIRAGEIDITATAAEQALMASGSPIYQRGGLLVRPSRREVGASNGRKTYAAGLSEIGLSGLTDMMCQAVEWQKYDGRSKEWCATNPPATVASVVLSRSGQWSFPSIAGVITTPTLRPDGTVLDAPGYDADTRLYHVDDPFLELKMPAPSKGAAQASLNALVELLSGFPFISDLDLSVALAALITPIVRGCMAVSPLFAFRASTAGSGKSYLVDLVSTIATGRPCPVASAGYDETETEKRLVGLLLSGYPLLSLDNVNGELGGDLLCQAAERPIIRVRELGRSTITEIENRAVLFATGNALRVRGDMVRRTVLCTLDANMERPELREFDFDPLSTVANNRGVYVGHCLTIVRSWLAAGETLHLPPLASFEDWSATVRSALVWLGQPDPCMSMDEARDDDPELTELREVVGLWREHIGPSDKRTIREIDEMTQAKEVDDHGYDTGRLRYAEFRDALLRVAGARNELNSKRLSKWLRDRRDRVVDGYRIVSAGQAKGGVARWCLEERK